jgi:hypothetical protein
MSVTGGDLRFFYSGGLGNSEGRFSLGGGISEHEIPTYQLDALFDDVPGGEAKDGVTAEYRCIYIKNINYQSALSKIILWSPTGGSVSPDTYFYFGMGSAPVNGQEPAIPNVATAPAHVTMAEYNSLKNVLAIEDLPAGAFRALWIWRKVKANARSFSRDQAIIEVDYFTPPPTTPGGGDGGGGDTPQCPDGYTYDPSIAMCVRASGGTGTSPAKTGHGVTLMYATLGGDRYFELMNKNQSNISQVDFQSTVSEQSGTKPNVAFKVSSQDQVRVEVGTVDTHGGFNDKSAIDNLDTAHLKSTGYMATNKDWRNYEAQWYLLVHSYSGSTSSGEAHMELEGRCGYNSTDSTQIGSPSKDRSCEATKYNANAYFTGRVKFEKCIMHTNGYSSSNPEKTNALSPAKWTGQWTGFKQVMYNIPNSTAKNGGPIVKIELYADQGNNASSPSNQWKKVIEAQDDGSGNVFSGPRGSYNCGSDHYIPVTWGGPLLIFRWDHLDAEFKWLSVYELDPAIKPAGTAGGPDVVPPLPGGGNQPPATPPLGSSRLYYICIAFAVSPSYDKTMVSISAQLVDTLVSPEPDNSNQYIIVGSTAYEVAGYCAGSWPSGWVQGRYGSSPTDEDLSAYWDDSTGKCVAPGAQSTTSSKTGSKGIVQNFYGPQLTAGPKVFVIFWGADWNTRSSEPTKAGLETRIRDYLLNRDKTYFSKLSQYGIDTAPTWGKSCVNVTTPVPSSNPIPESQFQQCIHDSIQKGLIDSPVLYAEECVYICIAPATKTAQLVDRTGATGGSTHYYYDYDASSSAPGHHDSSGGSSTLCQIYNYPGKNTPRNLYSGSITRFGWLVNTDSILLAQDPLTQIAFYISKYGSPTGTIYYRIRDTSGVVQCEFGSMNPATDIVSTGAPEKHLIRNESNQYQLQLGDYITCEYSGGNSTNYIKVDEVTNTADFDGTATTSVSYTGTTWTPTTTKNPAGELWSGYTLTAELAPGTGSGTGGGGSTTWGDPDTRIYNQVSTSTPNHMYSGAQTRGGEMANSASSILVGSTPTKIGFYLKRTGSPSGLVYCRMRDSSNTLIREYGSIDITLISNSTYTLYSWTDVAADNTHVMANGDRILIEFTGGSSGNELEQDESNSNSIDSTNTCAYRYSGSDSIQTGKEACMEIWTSSVAPGGSGGGGSPPPPPEPFSTVYDVSPSSISHLSFSDDQRQQGEFIDDGCGLIGKVLTRVTFYINRWGRGDGTLTATIRNPSNAVQCTMGVVNVTDLADNDNDQPVTFTNTSNTYALESHSFVAIEHSEHNGDLDGCRRSSQVSAAYVKWNNGSGSWGSSSSNDYVGTFEVGGV